MNSDIMAIDEQLVEHNNSVYGSNRVAYMLFIMGLCEGEKLYPSNSLKSMKHQQVNYDCAQKFPENKLTAALMSTQTELPQIHGKPILFDFCQQAEAVEFILSNMAGIDTVNVDAGIIKEMLRKYDSQSYLGANGNYGFKINPNTVITTTPAWDSTFTAFKVAVDAAMSRLRTSTTITSEDYGMVTLAYNATVSLILGTVDGSSGLSNLDILMKAYPGVMFREYPDNIEPDSSTSAIFSLSYSPMLTFHRASLPSIYATAQGKYGLSAETLYAFESMAVEVETLGAVQWVELVPV